MITIVVINESTTVSNQDVRTAVHALNQQVKNDFTPAWGVQARVVYHGKATMPPASAWVVAILDDSDQANALGYHDLTPTGYPVAKVFAGTDAEYGLSWTVTASHEITEMLADPDCNLAAQVYLNAKDSVWVGYEVADPVEADQYGYLIGSTLVSDFVLPSWFQPGLPRPYDFTGHLNAPLTLLPGGYVSLWTPQKGWDQVTAESVPGTTSRAVRAQRIKRRAKFDRKISNSARIEPARGISLLDLGLGR